MARVLDAANWMEKAIQAISKLEDGTIFVLKDLFEGTEWKALPEGDRLYFGKDFKHRVLLGSVPRVKYLKKAQNNSAQYIVEGRNNSNEK